MSVTKNKPTEYHATDQDVKFGLSWLRINHLDNLSRLELIGGLNGRVGTTDGVVEQKNVRFDKDELVAEFTAAEKTAARAFIAACERVLALKDEELSNETHDDTDVLVLT